MFYFWLLCWFIYFRVYLSMHLFSYFFLGGGGGKTAMLNSGNMTRSRQVQQFQCPSTHFPSSRTSAATFLGLEGPF